MANDPPTNQRMGFGFQQARAAGAPYTPSPTADQMNFHLKERAAEKKLRALRIKRPAIGSRIREYALHETNGYRLTTQQILFIIKCEIASQSKNGFVIHAIDGKSYRGEKVNEIFIDGLRFVLEGKPIFFRDGFIKDIVVDEADDQE